MLATKMAKGPPTKSDGKLTKSEQLKLVAREAAEIREAHARRQITSDEAARKLTDLKRRFESIWDFF
jgi:hypothetical protein